MTELLRQAISEVEKLPPEAQDAIAVHILADLQDEQAWQTRFAQTTDTQWDQLADQVRQEIAAGDVTPLEQLFPPADGER